MFYWLKIRINIVIFFHRKISFFIVKKYFHFGKKLLFLLRK